MDPVIIRWDELESSHVWMEILELDNLSIKCKSKAPKEVFPSRKCKMRNWIVKEIEFFEKFASFAAGVNLKLVLKDLLNEAQKA